MIAALAGFGLRNRRGARNMEIERKWLTRGWPEGLEPGSVIRMEQGYIATRPTVRIRLETQGDQVPPGPVLQGEDRIGRAGPGRNRNRRRAGAFSASGAVHRQAADPKGAAAVRPGRRSGAGGQPGGPWASGGIFLRRGGVPRPGDRPKLAARPSGGISGPGGHRDARGEHGGLLGADPGDDIKKNTPKMCKYHKN